MEAQFPVGSKVRYQNDLYDSTVLGYFVDAEKVVYKISGRSVNMKTMEVKEGVRHVGAEDLTLVPEVEELNSEESENE